MTFLNSGTRTLAPGCYGSFGRSWKTVTRQSPADGWPRAGFEGFLLTALFLFLAGSALYLRARLGFAL